MTDEHFTPVRTGALGVLLRVTAAKTAEFPVAEQIRIYQALSEALPDGQQKLQAREQGGGVATGISAGDARLKFFLQTSYDIGNAPISKPHAPGDAGGI